ncbi:hypothetical protein D3C81_1632450 [compost metagenome]
MAVSQKVLSAISTRREERSAVRQQHPAFPIPLRFATEQRQVGVVNVMALRIQDKHITGLTNAHEIGDLLEPFIIDIDHQHADRLQRAGADEPLDDGNDRFVMVGPFNDTADQNRFPVRGGRFEPIFLHKGSHRFHAVVSPQIQNQDVPQKHADI